MSVLYPQPENSPALKTPQLDENRALLAAAFIALIDRELTRGVNIIPRGEAVLLMQRLCRCGFANVSHAGGIPSLTLCGISAQSNSEAYGLLRNWQLAAKHRIDQGIKV